MVSVVDGPGGSPPPSGPGGGVGDETAASSAGDRTSSMVGDAISRSTRASTSVGRPETTRLSIAAVPPSGRPGSLSIRRPLAASSDSSRSRPP